MNWYPENIQTIKQVISKKTASRGPECLTAVFDFDNTCIFRDIGQAVFRYQCTHFRFRLPPAEFARLLPHKNLLLDHRPLSGVVATLTDYYKRLWAIVSEKNTVEKDTKEQKEFAVLLQWFVQQARENEQLGPKYILPLLCQFLAGFSLNQIEELVDEVIAEISREPFATGQESLHLPQLGNITFCYEMGIKPFAEMHSLMHWLTETGVRCHVISASTNWLVQAAVKRYNYPVASGDIYGIRCVLDANDILTTTLPDHYPVTFRQGKADIIQMFLKAPPLLVAGDADTDFEILTLPDIPLRLIINRNQKGVLRPLYDHPDYLIQGIDTCTGQFRPSRETSSRDKIVLNRQK